MGAVRKAFAGNLAYHRERRGLTQAKLAELVESSPSYIGHLERGEREPSLLTIEELARALGVQAGELFVVRKSESTDPALDEMLELLRGRDREDIRLALRLARAAFEDPRLAGATTSVPVEERASRPRAKRRARGKARAR